MDANYEIGRLEVDEFPEEGFLAFDPIGLTFASGIHESDLLSSLERTRHLAGEVC